jgi:hypothetical protein
MNGPIQEHSQIYKKYLWLMLSMFGLWAIYSWVIWVPYLNGGKESFPLFEVFIQIVIPILLIQAIFGKSVYMLGEDAIDISFHEILRGKSLHIPYEDILGVCHYHDQSGEPIKFHHIYRMYGKLDKKPVWHLFYKVPGPGNRVSSVMMKGSDEFWKAFRDKVPGKICIPQDDALAAIYEYMAQK